MASLLDFVDRVRTLQDLPPHGVIALLDTEPDDEDKCVLAKALGCRIAPVDATEHEPEWLFAMHFKDRLLARRIGIVMGLEWRADPPAVRLPDAVADIAVSEHLEAVEADGIGLLRGWWVPADGQDGATGQWDYCTPTDPDLLPDAQWKLPSPRPRS